MWASGISFYLPFKGYHLSTFAVSEAVAIVCDDNAQPSGEAFARSLVEAYSEGAAYVMAEVRNALL
jgi:hypothetical protein